MYELDARLDPLVRAVVMRDDEDEPALVVERFPFCRNG